MFVYFQNRYVRLNILFMQIYISCIMVVSPWVWLEQHVCNERVEARSSKASAVKL